MRQLIEMSKIKTGLRPEQYRYVSTSKISGWVKLRLAAREIPVNENQKVKTSLVE